MQCVLRVGALRMVCAAAHRDCSGGSKNAGALTSGAAGAQTLERSYLLRINGQVVERPQHMLMRVSLGIHKGDLDSALRTYHLLSERWFTHASPTLFNAGTPRPQLSSCFLICAKNDSIEVAPSLHHRPPPAPIL